MIDLKEEKDTYLANFARFEKEVATNGHPSLHRLRKAAMKRFTELGFPTSRNEEWKFTSVAPIAKIPFRPVPAYDTGGVTAEALEQSEYQIGDAIRVVFLNGHYAPELSSPEPLPDGVIVTSLASALHAHAELVEPHLGRHAAYEDHAFTA